MREIPNILIVSDLHLSRGYYAPEASETQGGHFSDLEDFFADEAFFSFVAHHVAQGGKWQFILNGDIVDFLQVVDFPGDQETLTELRCVVRQDRDWEIWKAKKQQYGLGTTAIETRWKLKQIVAGHPVFFLALAYVLATGHQVVIVSGNHDIEWYWPQVQDCLRELIRQAYDPAQIQERLSEPTPAPSKHETEPRQLAAVLSESALDGLRFCPRFYYLQDLLYVEHGCQYDVSNSFPDMADPVLPADRDLDLDQQRIELPIGSFFVRHFFNLVEQGSPFADNVKPILRYFKWVIRNQFGWVIKMLATRSEVVRVIWQRLNQIHNSRVAQQSHLQTGAPPAPERYGLGAHEIADPVQFAQGLQDLEERVFRSRPPLLYVRPKNWFVATKGFSHDMLIRAAKAIRELLRTQGQDARYFVLGHDHNAAVQSLGDGAWYYNTGTWALIEGERERFFRDTRELTYVKIVPGADEEAQLLRWNDGPNRGDRVILMTGTKESKAASKLWGLAMLAGGATLLALVLKKWQGKK